MRHVRVEGIGIDAAEIGRFRTPKTKRNDRFFANTFSITERQYCLSHRDPAPHFAGTFAGKEAVRKVYGDRALSLSHIEIRRNAAGGPEVWIRGKRKHSFMISITHTTSVAFAVAVGRAA